ncbi:DUF2867 domain-containing protein [Primorskyibacter sp. S187A]|uniref:DUF2867 domain-containing protein n=1 Tax=Primorskyibacter sp. S187A TaxID=3415130 RepID=UPI003C7C6A7C
MSRVLPFVSKIELPPGSLLEAYRRPGDFLDCYAVSSSLSPRLAAEEIVRFPGWAQALVALRNIVTAPFGLSADGPEAEDKLGVFPVEHETETEIIAGFDDRHLDFRVSVMAHAGRVSLATWVRPHNLGGRLYLALIMPFHIAIARDAVRRVAKVGDEVDGP